MDGCGTEEGEEDRQLPNQGKMRLSGVNNRSDLRSKDSLCSSCLSGEPCKTLFQAAAEFVRDQRKDYLEAWVGFFSHNAAVNNRTTMPTKRLAVSKALGQRG